MGGQVGRGLVLLLLCLISTPTLWAETTDTAVASAPNSTEESNSPENENNSFMACAREDLTGTKQLSRWQVGLAPSPQMHAPTIQFFKAYLASLQEYAEQYKAIGTIMNICMANPTAQSELCHSFRDFESTEMRNKIREARFELSMSLGHDEEPNVRLHPGKDSVKMLTWERLDDEEKSRAAQYLKIYADQIKQKNNWTSESFAVPSNLHKFIDQMGGQRRIHYKRYVEIMSELPILQYIRSANPSQQEVANATAKILENAEADIEHLRSVANQLAEYEKDPVQSPFPSELYELLAYRPHLEGFLFANKGQCPIANDLYNLHARHSTVKNIALTGALFATGFLAPPIVGVAVGVGASAYLGTTSYQDYKKVKAHSFAIYQNTDEKQFVDASGKRLKSEDGTPLVNTFRGGTMDSAASARNQFKMEMYLGPLAFLGGGIPKWAKFAKAAKSS